MIFDIWYLCFDFDKNPIAKVKVQSSKVKYKDKSNKTNNIINDEVNDKYNKTHNNM